MCNAVSRSAAVPIAEVNTKLFPFGVLSVVEHTYNGSIAIDGASSIWPQLDRADMRPLCAALVAQ